MEDRFKDPFEKHWDVVVGQEDEDEDEKEKVEAPKKTSEPEKERIERIRAQLKNERETPLYGKLIHETDKEFLLRKYDELMFSFVGVVPDA